MKGLGLFHKLDPVLPWTSALALYEFFIRPYLDYRDAIYDQPLNESFSNNLETVPYTTALAITGTI